MGGERPLSTAAVMEDEREGAGITIEVLQQHFHQPLVTVAEELGVSLTMIKRLCRKLGMPRWPYRQIDSINKAMEDLQDQLEGARTEADRARYCKLLEAALKKKRLITRGAAAGVDPNVRNALYLADTADVSEEDIFGNPELMPKLSAALKTITKRKRVKGKPLVDLIATVQRDGSLPACVQTVGGSASTSTATTSSCATNVPSHPPLGSGAPVGGGDNGSAGAGRGGSGSGSGSGNNAGGRGARPIGGVRRQNRPPTIADAIATTPEEYVANIEQAYGDMQRPGSSTSATTSVSPALSSLGNSNSSMDDYARHGWGHNAGASGSVSGGSGRYPSQQQQQQQHYVGAHKPLASARSAPPTPAIASDDTLDSPASSCTTLITGASPGGGSMSGGFSPVTKSELSPAPAGGHMLPSHHSRVGADGSGPLAGGGGMRSGMMHSSMIQVPQSAPARSAGGHHWGQHRQVSVGGGQLRPQKRLSATSSGASTDIGSLDTSHLLEFDDDDDDEIGPDGGQLDGIGGAGEIGGGSGGGVDGYGLSSGTVGAGGNANGGGAQGVSPEELQELEDALLMDNFGGVADDVLDGEDIAPSTFPDTSSHHSFPNLRNVGASLPPLPRAGHASGSGSGGGQRSAARSTSGAGSSSPHLLSASSFGASPVHAGCASPVAAVASSAAGVPIGSNSNSNSSSNGNNANSSGAPRPGPRVSGMGRSRNQVPPRPYTPGKSTRGGLSVPWLSHGLGGGISPRVGGASPRPPTPGTPGTRMIPSPNGRRRGDEAFPEHFVLPSPHDPAATGLGGPSPKARRVGGRAVSARFPGSPQAGLSPRVDFQISPQAGGAPGGFNVGASSNLDAGGSDRTYFPAPAAAAGLAASPNANGASRGHRRSSSSGWGANQRPGSSGGEAAMDASAGTSTAAPCSIVNSSFQVPSTSQGWGMRLGDSANQSLPGRPNWGVSTSGETHTGRPSLSSHDSLSMANEGATPAAAATMANHGHGVMRRRHSSPIPPLPSFPAGTALGDTRGESPGMPGPGKSSDFPKTEYNLDAVDGLGNVMESQMPVFDASGEAPAANGWTTPAPPPSPMPDKCVYWPPHASDGQQQASGDGMSQVSAAAVAAVAAVAAAAVPASGSLSAPVDSGHGLSAQITTTMPVDL